MTATNSASQQVGQVADQISGYLVRYDSTHDPRAVFAYVYWRLTSSLSLSLAADDPQFRDAGWVAELAECLAAEYFVAMDQIDNWVSAGPGFRSPVREEDLPREIPEPWRAVCVAAAGRRSYVLEDALFGMMAHISFDLPMALWKMASRMTVPIHIADFHTMNSVFGAVIESIQSEVASRYSWVLAGLDHIFARNDELLTNYGIRVARGMAWYNFERMCDPDSATEAKGSIARSTGAFIRQIREPEDWRLRTASALARRLVPERRQWPSPTELPRPD